MKNKIIFIFIAICIIKSNYVKAFESNIYETDSVKQKMSKADSAGMYNFSGVISLVIGEYKLAKRDFNKAIKLTPNNAILYKKRAEAEFGLNNFNGCIADCNIALKLNRSDAEIYQIRSKAEYKKNDFTNAIKDCDKAISLDANNHSYYYLRGLIKEKTKDYINAIIDFTKAIDINSNSEKPVLINAYRERAQCKMQLNDYRGAITDFKTHTEIDSNDVSTYINIGSCNNNIDNNWEAINYYNKAIEMNPKIPEIYLYLGLTQLKMNKIDEACQSWSKAGELGFPKAYEYIKKYCNN